MSKSAMKKSEGRRLIAAVLVVTTLACEVTAGQGTRARQAREQVSFGAETPVERIVRLPPDVLRTLSRFDNGRV